jgi:hypothetical protein
MARHHFLAPVSPDWIDIMALVQRLVAFPVFISLSEWSNAETRRWCRSLTPKRVRAGFELFIGHLGQTELVNASNLMIPGRCLETPSNPHRTKGPGKMPFS